MVVGSATAGAISMAFDAQLRAPHGGIFVLGLIDGKLGYLLAGAVGTAVTALMVVALKSLRRTGDAVPAEGTSTPAPAARQAVTTGA